MIDQFFTCRGSESLLVECKLNLSRTLSELEVVNDLDKAESLLQEILELSSNSTRLSKEKYFEIKDEMIKFHLKQDKYEKALKLLNETVKEKIDHYTEFSLKLNSSYKLLCSIYLKRNDMENAVKYLQKVINLEYNSYFLVVLQFILIIFYSNWYKKRVMSWRN